MPRPKAVDPKIAVTLRIPASVVEAYKAKGGDFRDHMRDAVIAGVAGKSAAPAPKPQPVKAAKAAGKPATTKNRVSVGALLSLPPNAKLR